MTLRTFFRSKKTETFSENDEVFMLVGLGNPGREYRNTRHNIGFMVIDKFSSQHDVSLSKVQSNAIIGVKRVFEKKVIIVKPQTYMNLSGQAVSALARYYKVPISNLMIVHDDVDLPFGVIRMRPGGGSAGQKGVGSIIEKLGVQEFPRLRMGVGRPPGRMDAAGFVLLPFEKSEQEFVEQFLDRAVDALHCFIVEDLDSAMNKFNPTS